MALGFPRGPNSNLGPNATGRDPIEVIASTTTIAPQSRFVRVTGTTDIATITPPTKWWVGPLYVVNSDASVNATVTTGNILLAVTLTRYKVFTFVYDRSVSKWYTSATS